MKEFFKNNKKTAIVFACSVVVIIVCAIVGNAVAKDDEIRITFRDESSVGEVSGEAYETFNADELSSTEAVSSISDASSEAASAE